MTRKILIVDDYSINRRILQKILSDEYETIEAENGLVAMDILRAEKEISAVLLDLFMPQMDGFEVLKEMRSDSVLEKIPVVAVTGADDDEIRVRCLALGANDFITKPYNPEIVRHCLKLCISLHETTYNLDVLQKDKITGLYNRQTFFEKADELIRQKPSGYYVISCFDINNFKLINDQYGVIYGDSILRYVGKTILLDMQRVDGIGCRISADNFAALFPTIVDEKKSHFIDNIQEFSDVPEPLKSSTAFSIGRYVINDLTLSSLALYDRAYIAKQSIKGRYDVNIAYFDEKMLEKLVRDQQVIADMDVALAEKQFEVWYQPQYNHATGSLVGAEALVRWRHPVKGLISPGVFIPVFEQNGFIYELDKFVWEQVCINLRRWIDEGTSPLPVSMNISRFDVFRSDLIEVITSLADKYNLSSDLLRFEITESAFATSTQQIVKVVQELISHGFILEIDDFGSGYSSLNTLKSVPAQVLKLDMKFLESDGIDSQRGGNIIESVVRMTKWLGMSVIAEGVETVEQADFLKTIGCNYVQGYLYARPMPVGEYETLAHTITKEAHLASIETVEHLNNNAFWNPVSLDTLVFNNYVGGACIIEQNQSHVEILRANEKFALEIGDGRINLFEALKIKLSSQIYPDDLQSCLDAMNSAKQTNKEVTCIIRYNEVYQGQGLIYLQIGMRIIASSGNRFLYYCSVNNITKQVKNEKEIHERDEQLSFLNDIAHDLLSNQDSDKGIESTLRKLLEYFSGDCAYIFEFYHDTKTVRNTYEVDSVNTSHRKSILHNVNLNKLSSWFETIKKNSFCEIPDRNQINPEEEIYKVLVRYGINSLIGVPLNIDGKLIGFMGIDEPRQNQSYISRLSAIGDYISVLLAGRDLNERIQRDNQMLRTLMDDTPGGFCRLRRSKNSGFVPEFFNDGLLRLFSMTRKQIKDIFSEDVFSGVFPDDLPIIKKALDKLDQVGEVWSPRFRIIDGNGQYNWVVCYVKKIVDISSDIFYNVYFTSADELERQREVLENLPCGVGICILSNNKAFMSYLNQRYFSYFKNRLNSFKSISVFDAIHPEDRIKLKKAMKPALTDGGEGTCVVRIKDGDKDYLTFRLVGKAPKKQGQGIIYVTFTPITHEELSFVEMIPVALKAVMSTQSEVAFVKDKNLRYVCASPACVIQSGFKTEDQMLGKTDYDIFPKNQADNYIAEDIKVLKIGKPQLRIPDKVLSDGENFYSETSKYPLYNSLGEIIGIYGIGHNITEQKKTDSQLQLLTNSIPGGIVSYERVSGEYRISYLNEGFAKMFGLSVDEYLEFSDDDPLKGVDNQYLPILRKKLAELVEIGDSIDFIYRVFLSNGKHLWVNLKATVTEKSESKTYINAVFLDITEQHDAIEQLRISEETNRLALKHSGCVIAQLDILTRVGRILPEVATNSGQPEIMEDIPNGPVKKGLISRECIDTYIDFYESIYKGSRSGSAVYKEHFTGKWRWVEAKYSTIFSSNGKPVSAIISYFDVTEKRERDAIYQKWFSMMHGKDPASYSLFRCFVTHQQSQLHEEGSLFKFKFSSQDMDFDKRTEEFNRTWVLEDDRPKFWDFLNYERVLDTFRKGIKTNSIEFRYIQPDTEGAYRWIKLTVELVDYPNSSDIEAYLLFEDIDRIKRQQLSTLNMAERDPLTGVYNRNTFAAKVEKIISQSDPDAQHAMMMIDIDGFKQLNDAFGHVTGDNALIEMAQSLRKVVRKEDPIGRLGGDEFFVFLSDIPSEDIVVAKAKQICALMRRSYSVEIEISGSIGIVLVPQDGIDFNQLYTKADVALYHVKGSGKNSFAFYREEMEKEHLEYNPSTHEVDKTKRRMLIVDDSQIDCSLLSRLFSDEFIIEKAKDGNSALVRLRHYGAAISVVLLDLMMPGIDGFTVLEKIQSSADLRTIPVIVVSSADDHETTLRVIRNGAYDFVTKPIDPELLRIRVKAAISRSENDRLRVKNAFLEYQNSLISRYKVVLNQSKIAMVEYNWIAGTFSYEPEISNLIGGVFDNRRLWMILLSDMVAETATVKQMQEMVHHVAEDETLTEDTLRVKLRTPSKKKAWFDFSVYKLVNHFNAIDVLLLVFKEIDSDNR